MAMTEMTGISKFKLQLLALVSESRHLRESERSTREQIDLCNQRQRQIEAEYGQKLQKLRAELGSRDDLVGTLQNKVKYLEHENVLLGRKEKELMDTVNSLLQSRDKFISVYENSTYTLRQDIETRDRRISVLSEKINSQMLLIDSIEKEAAGVKKVLHEVQNLVNEKEHVVTELKVKMGNISSFEKEFPKISFLDSKVNEYQQELRRRARMISELKEYIEEKKVNDNSRPEIDELRKALLVKEELIQSLTTDKQSLIFELQNLEHSIHSIEDAVANMSTENQHVSSPIVEGQGVCRNIINRGENISLGINISENEDSLDRSTVARPTENSNSDMLLDEGPATNEDPPSTENVLNQCLPKPPKGSSQQSVCSDPSPKVNANPHT